MTLNKEFTRTNSGAGISLAAGIIILVSGFVFSFWHFAFFPTMSSMMGTPFNVNMSLLSVAIIACGAIIIGLSILMYKVPQTSRVLGAFIILFSVLSILEMGGFLIGGILGIIGGVLAISKN